MIMRCKKTIVYMRYSSTMQDDGFSIEYQRNETKEYAHKQGLVIDAEFVDEAKTGTKVAGRDGFYSMIRAIKNKEVEVLIVYKLSRLFRNTKESEYYRDLFRHHGVRLISATEYIDEETSTGRMTTSMLSIIDQYQSEITSDQVRSSMREMARQGFFTGGHTPFGYALEEIPHGTKTRKRFVPHDTEAEIINKVFELYANGQTINGIVRHLNDQGIRTKAGKKFCRATVINFLKNDTYLGIVKYKAKGYDEVICEDAHPAIVSRTIFDAVQERFRFKAKGIQPRKHNYFYPLTGKIYCECGAHFVGVSFTRYNKDRTIAYSYITYQCHARQSYKTCHNRFVYRDALQSSVMDAIKSNVLDANLVDSIASKVVAQCKDNPSDIALKLRELTRQANELNKEIDILIEMRKNGELSPNRSKQRIDPLEQDLVVVENAIASLQMQKETAITHDGVKAYLMAMLEESANATDDVLKSIFDNFVEKLIISKDNVELHLRVLPDSLFAVKQQVGTPILRLTVKCDYVKPRNCLTYAK